MVHISCGACGKGYNLEQSYQGKKVKCAACQEAFVVDFSKKKEEITSPQPSPLQEKEQEQEANLGLKEKAEVAQESEEIMTEEVGEREEKEASESKSEPAVISVVSGGVKKAEASENLEIKPHKWSYILLGNISLIILPILILISLVLAPFTGGISTVATGIFLVLLVLIYGWNIIKYKKESYTLTDRKIIYSYGNLFSDNSVEVNLDKVTQVKSRLGFIQYKIFGTGDLEIKTAGSSSSKIRLKNISDTMKVYEETQVRMKKNGFHLQKDKLVQTAYPHWLGIIGEIFGKVVANFIIFIYIGAGVTEGLSESGFGDIGVIASLPVILFAILTIGMVILSYLDLKRREYNVYTDSIFYTEGFLTKNYSFLPMESVADIENTQSFFSKIFGLHDVIVSSEGADNKVGFKNMIDGEKMMNNIKYLKDNIIMNEKDAIEGEAKSANSLIGFKDKVEVPLDYDKEFTAEYKMSMLKAILVVVPFLVFPPVGIFGIIVQIIRVKFTRLIVSNSSIESKFHFLSNKHNSFSVEKITGVVVNQSILDRILGTCSISFWSIGSSKSIKFSGVKKTPDLEKNILAKVGIKLEEESTDIPVRFSFMNLVKSSIWYFGFVGILSALIILINILMFIVKIFEQSIHGTIIADIYNSIISVYNIFYYYIDVTGVAGFVIILLLVGLPFLYKKFFYNKKRYIQKLHTNFIESISGIFYITKYYSLFRNVKGAHSKKYPLTKAGTFIVNISGEQKVETMDKKGKHSVKIVSNTIKIPYAADIFTLHDTLDVIIHGEALDENSLAMSKQDIGNSIFMLVIFMILGSGGIFVYNYALLIPFVVFFGLILGLIIWNIKVKFYDFQKNRVLFKSGIIYKKRHSILYDKFNFIEKNQGFVNKIFKNGMVKVYTLGSGSVEMHLKDVDNYVDIYELLKKD